MKLNPIRLLTITCVSAALLANGACTSDKVRPSKAPTEGDASSESASAPTGDAGNRPMRLPSPSPSASTEPQAGAGTVDGSVECPANGAPAGSDPNQCPAPAPVRVAKPAAKRPVPRVSVSTKRSTTPALTPTSYELKGKDRHGRSCSTGPQSFRSLEAKCVGLLDPSRAFDDCARTERLRLFEADCKKIGFTPFETNSCRVSLVRKHEPIMSGSVAPQHIVKSVNYCTGRLVDGSDLNSIYGSRELADGVYADAFMDFHPVMNAGPGKYSTFTLKLWRTGPSGERVELAPEFRYVDKGDVSRGTSAYRHEALADDSYRYQIECGATWSCPMPRGAFDDEAKSE
jgi:hypothetical protein